MPFMILTVWSTSNTVLCILGRSLTAITYSMASLRYIVKVACYSNTALAFISISNYLCIYVWFFYIQGRSIQLRKQKYGFSPVWRKPELYFALFMYICLISLCRFWCLRIDLGSLRCLHPGSTGLSIVSKPSIDWAFMNAVLGGWMGGSSRDASKLAVVNMYIVCIYCVNTWLWFYLLFFHFICRNIHCNCILKH